MKVSEIQVKQVAEYLRLSESLSESDSLLLGELLTVAKKYISDWTGIPEAKGVQTEPGAVTLDDHEEFYVAIMILCQDMYDNRCLSVDKANGNRVVEAILNMHCKTLL